MFRHLLPWITAACVSGCYATVTPAGSVDLTAAYVEPPAPVVEIETSPYVVYEGRTTYFYDGRWYYQDRDRRWRTYHTEPQYLQQHRSRVEREWRDRHPQGRPHGQPQPSHHPQPPPPYHR